MSRKLRRMKSKWSMRTNKLALLIVFVLLWSSAAQASLSKTFFGSTTQDGLFDTVQLTFDSTGYNHVVCFVKHEGAPTTITEADNKSSGAYNLLTKIDHANGDLSSRMMWVKIGTPGSGHTVTVTFGSGRLFVRLACWGVNATSGDITLDVEAANQGTGTAIDAGTLATTAATVSFMGIGEYASVTYTPGSGWTEDLDSAIHGQSRADASGTLDPVATASGSMAWAANAASFKEVGGAAPTVRTMTLMGVGQ